jgi:hypothetical protein
MANILNNGKFIGRDSNGDPLAGGKLYTYLAGASGTTNKATYTDSTLATPNANPVILDGNGRANVWLGTGGYAFVLKDSNDNTEWSVDNYIDQYEDDNEKLDSLNVAEIADLLDSASSPIDTDNVQKVFVNNFWNTTDRSQGGGGGEFWWDSATNKNQHDGGLIIDPSHAAPVISSGEPTAAWYTATGSTAGVWRRVLDSKEIDLSGYGKFSGDAGDLANVTPSVIASDLYYCVIANVGRYAWDGTNWNIEKREVSRTFQSMADLMTLDSTDTTYLSDGDIVELTGFYVTTGQSFTDGKYNVKYWWDNTTASGQSEHNGGTVIDPTHSITPGTTGWWTSENSGTGVFRAIVNEKLNVLWFGVKGDNATDDTEGFQAALDYFQSSDIGTFFIPNTGSSYLVKTLNIGAWNIDGSNNVLGVTKSFISKIIEGEYNYVLDGASALKFNDVDQPGTTIQVITDSVGSYNYVTDDKPVLNIVAARHCTFRNLNIDGDDKAFSSIHNDQNVKFCTFENLILRNSRIGLRHGTREDWGGSAGSPYYGHADSPYYIANVFDYPSAGGFDNAYASINAVHMRGCRIGLTVESQQAFSIVWNVGSNGDTGAQTGITDEHDIAIYGGNLTLISVVLFMTPTSTGNARIRHISGSCRLICQDVHCEQGGATPSNDFFQGTTSAAADPRIELRSSDIENADISIRGGDGRVTIVNCTNIGTIARTWKTSSDNKCTLFIRNSEIDHITNTGDSSSNTPSLFIDAKGIDRNVSTDAFITDLAEWTGTVENVYPSDGIYNATKWTQWNYGTNNYELLRDDGLTYIKDGIEHFKDSVNGVVDEAITVIGQFDCSTNSRKYAIYVDIAVVPGNFGASTGFIKTEQLIISITTDDTGNITHDIQQSTDSAIALDGYASITTTYALNTSGTDVQLQLTANNETADSNNAVIFSGRVTEITNAFNPDITTAVYKAAP